MRARILIMMAWAGLVTMSPLTSSAGSLEDGEKDLIQARREYFNTIFHGNASSRDEQAALYKRTIGAASGKLNRSIVDRWKETIQRRTSIRPNGSAPPPETQHELARIAQTDGGKTQNHTNAEAGTSSGGSAPDGISSPLPLASAARKDTALDGSNVPRLLEFGAKKKTPPAR